jgi:hypothetical protein
MKDQAWKDGFNEGVLNALALMNAHGDADGTQFRELVSLAGEDDLLAYARRQCVMRWSGLDKYMRNKRLEAALSEKGHESAL